ncbi:putative antisense-enhancing sequence [Clavispora lusitaniae]|uniref:Antisense-enhancing sequence n=1 Tax=Clavispora lusitaniae TaxID=36911 RepID=A0ACD0WGL7_CLALS|nr:putative antisense-enhancing sequence [Clavispora lusitaniae]QFZ31880.1 putative antisense-enhancing sequence [Clavispora lusitaniae]QFZ37549.1 putative antisense-enhancing sequence [Clavispora lusitaniae]QFZ43233.1 putative antisense-enhancing sequence [Clavispora lusitaniae]QFZ48909.1 putative antisense-enhancing sequence [Clavispora lusitaniae]
MPTFKQVDVFTSQKYRGNPVAVFFNAEEIPDSEKSLMSAWTNLSEATFVQKPTHPEADYKVQIFALQEELPFAGHPTIGTCHALLEAGLIEPKNGKIVQECGAGLVTLSVSEAEEVEISFVLPYAKPIGGQEQYLEELSCALGGFRLLGAFGYDVGPLWYVVELENAEVVIGLTPDFAALSALSEKMGITGFQVLGRHAEQHTFETRTFAPLVGIKEDPVCGSGSGATGAYLRDKKGFNGDVYLRQGTVLNREGRIKVTCDKEISVRGSAVTVINGEY